MRRPQADNRLADEPPALPMSLRCPTRSLPTWTAWCRLVGLTWLALAAAWAQAPARANGLSVAEVKAVRTVIEAQLAAFAADDAQRAFSHATAGIRQQFGDAERFMAMVRNGYPMVVRPSSASFFQPRRVDTVVLQVVQLRDGAGKLWRATYQVEPQRDGSWQIGGCVVVPADAGSTT